MKVAIVGSSVLSNEDERVIRKHCEALLLQLKHEHPHGFTVISGGAKGVDSIAVEIASSLGLETKVYPPNTNDWAGYKERNIKIANDCDKLFCFPAKLRDQWCYHCNKPHQRSGGCWTAKICNKPKIVFDVVKLKELNKY